MAALTNVAIAWVAIASVAALALTVLDKWRARRRGARIPERVLLGAGLVGGTPGLVLGMLLVRHKTRKASFLARLFAIVAVQALLVAAWLRESGAA